MRDVESCVITTSSPTKRKVLRKLQETFGFDFRHYSFNIVTYKGSQDADAYRWFTIGLPEEINSRLTMSEFVRNKKAFYDYGWNTDGVIIDEGISQPELKQKPSYAKEEVS
jgi:hypothetical protein